MTDLLAMAPARHAQPLTFTREAQRHALLHARLRYAADQLFQDGLDNGIRIERTYSPFLEDRAAPPATSYKAGDLVRVTLQFDLTKERRYVAVTDPLPAGFEPVESWFASTAASLRASQDDQGSVEQDWFGVVAPGRIRPCRAA